MPKTQVKIGKHPVTIDAEENRLYIYAGDLCVVVEQGDPGNLRAVLVDFSESEKPRDLGSLQAPLTR